jgi:erythritol transport system ATP-binding protein
MTSPQTAPDHNAVDAFGITKVFPGTTALSGVDFHVAPGRVHALIGENGAGKSTLVKILAGIERPTAGRLMVNGTDVRFDSVDDAVRHGIGIVHQELQLFPDLSIAENLFVGRERRTRWGLVDANAQQQIAVDRLAMLGQRLDPARLVGSLPLGLQQIVEIARALVTDTKVLMMDEPTSALTPSEIAVLFRVIRDLAARGVAIVYISHRLEELLGISDMVSVLRDGQLVGEAKSSEVDVQWIVEKMTGRLETTGGIRPVPTPGSVALSVRNLHMASQQGHAALRDVSFDLRRGEIIGLYGLMGAGRTELFEALMGVHSGARGDIVLNGRRIDGVSVADRVRAGLAMVPEDRQAAGLVPTMSVLENMTLSSLSRVSTRGCLALSREREATQAMVDTLRIKTRATASPIGDLSGGNQQKVVISRAVMNRPSVLLFDEPTRGVDVSAKAEILAYVRRLAAEGAAVMYASSDLGEVRAVADRVIVLSRGRVTADGSAAELAEHVLASAASQSLDSTPEGFDARP